MQQAQALQARMKEMQESAASKTVEAQSGGGMVKVVVDGTMRVRKIEIAPPIVAANDKAMLEHMIIVAVNYPISRAQQMLPAEMRNFGPLAALPIPAFTTEEPTP